MLAMQQLSDQMSPSLGARDMLDHNDLFSYTVVMLLSAWLMCCPLICSKNNMSRAIAAAFKWTRRPKSALVHLMILVYFSFGIA